MLVRRHHHWTSLSLLRVLSTQGQASWAIGILLAWHVWLRMHGSWRRHHGHHMAGHGLHHVLRTHRPVGSHHVSIHVRHHILGLTHMTVWWHRHHLRNARIELWAGRHVLLLRHGTIRIGARDRVGDGAGRAHKDVDIALVLVLLGHSPDWSCAICLRDSSIGDKLIFLLLVGSSLMQHHLQWIESIVENVIWPGKRRATKGECGRHPSTWGWGRR